MKRPGEPGDSSISLAFREATSEENLTLAISEARDLKHTSEAQKKAIISAMSKRLTIVQGPPGTGKTHTSVRILSFWVTWLTS